MPRSPETDSHRMAPGLSLSEDLIDDLLFFSRTADLEELKSTLAEAAKSHDASELDILSVTVDPETQNTVLHMAAANGHIGITVNCPFF